MEGLLPLLRTPFAFNDCDLKDPDVVTFSEFWSFEPSKDGLWCDTSGSPPVTETLHKLHHRCGLAQLAATQCCLMRDLLMKVNLRMSVFDLLLPDCIIFVGLNLHHQTEAIP